VACVKCPRQSCVIERDKKTGGFLVIFNPGRNSPDLCSCRESFDKRNRKIAMAWPVAQREEKEGDPGAADGRRAA